MFFVSFPSPCFAEIRLISGRSLLATNTRITSFIVLTSQIARLNFFIRAFVADVLLTEKTQYAFRLFHKYRLCRDSLNHREELISHEYTNNVIRCFDFTDCTTELLHSCICGRCFINGNKLNMFFVSFPSPCFAEIRLISGRSFCHEYTKYILH